MQINKELENYKLKKMNRIITISFMENRGVWVFKESKNSVLTRVTELRLKPYN